MIARRFHSRRVWLLHGLLLVAVLAAAYISGRAQYRSIRDQRLEEMRVNQQNSARTTALLIEQNIRLLAIALPELDDRVGIVDAVPRTWIRAVATVGRSSWSVESPSATNADRVRQLLTRRADVLKIVTPTLMTVDGELFLATPMRDVEKIRIAILSKEQISLEVQSIKARVLDADSYIGVDGPILNGEGQTTLRQIIPNHSALNEVQTLIDAGSVGTSIIELPSPHEISLVTVQPVVPLPGAKWFLLIKRDRVDEQIARTLRPLIWQLASGASMMVVAVAVVLVSTTISLYRGRRRIERLRMEMLNRDLQKARAIQLNWLPAPFRETSDYAIAAVNEPAAHISGDFYNWFDLPINAEHPTRRTAVVIGDVSGHGLPAAFLMATTQLIINTTLPAHGDPGACLTELNRQLCSLAYQGQFVTIMVLVVDHDQGAIAIASAGQGAPLLKRGRACDPIDHESQLVIGVDDSIVYEAISHPFRPGDQLLLYTDGVVETTNNAGEQFSLNRLADAFLAAPDDPQRTIHSVLGAVATHRQGGDADDDLTLVAMRLTATPHQKHPDEAAMV